MSAARLDLFFAESEINGWGTEQHVAALAISMAQRGHRVRCLISTGSPLEATLGAAGVPTILDRLERGGSFNVRRMRLLHRLVSADRPDWLITNDSRFYWPVLLTGRMTGTRTALFRHWENMSRGMITRRALPRLADRFILVSRFQRAHFKDDGVDVSRMQILYNPIDTQRLHPSAEARSRVRQALGVTEPCTLVGYVGRMVRTKGVFTLLPAAERMLTAEPQARMLWVGDGGDLAELRAEVAQSPHADRHLFRSWTDDVHGIYNALDLLVVPSLYKEPFGRVSVEAQSCGTPVVCSDAGGLPETLQPDITGLLVPRGDVGQLTTAVLALMRDPARRSAMAVAAREFACASFSFGRIAESFEALLADRRYMPPLPGTRAHAAQGGVPQRQPA